jgi:hypothetical protein
VTDKKEALLTKLGFRFGINGPHAARTMMLEDLRQLMAHTPPDATRAEYASAVVDSNVLGKPTRSARSLALKHLTALYGLDPSNPLFRALRRFWPLNEQAQPILALAAALARDPLLRQTQGFILEKAVGTPVPRASVEDLLNMSFPGRFSAASLQSFAQNVAGTWTAAGLLEGRARKVRSNPYASPEAVAFLLFIGYLEGLTGQRLLSSKWLSLLGLQQDEVDALTAAASHRGLLLYMSAGGVKEIRFPDYLTSEEQKIQEEAAHVV